MEKEKQSTITPIVRDLLTPAVYKRSQGRIARQVTFAALALTFGVGAWRLSEYWITQDNEFRYGIPALIILVGLWISFRVVNLPRFADFLIAVEAEMNKVSWPSRGELIRSTIVVLVTIFTLALILAAYDIFWGFLLRDVLRIV